MEQPEVSWECLDCGDTHHTENDAESCCHQDFQDDLEIFRCSLCNTVHDTVKGVRDCCKHSRKVYLCPICESHHIVEGNALFCCPRSFDPLWQMRCDYRVLEKHGQLRLPF